MHRLSFRFSLPCAVAACLWACPLIGSAVATPITYEEVTVGNPGNAADTRTGSLYGAVSYSYQIGTYDVTGSQYTAFLNAVGSTDAYSLYNSNMGTNTQAAKISRSGASGSYTYAVMNGTGSRPITYVSWFDCARFANWMSNGQGSGNTETGAYTLLSGQTSGSAPAANSGASFRIPTENEWYKAAYYSPNYGGSSIGGYWTYATQSNSAPGITIGSSANQANWNSDGESAGSNTATNVGSFSGSASFYGTFDQSGNVDQWNDLGNTTGSYRGLRGGYWGSYPSSNISSSVSNSSLAQYGDSSSVGFRLATPIPVVVPEPSTWAMGLGGLASGGWQMLRRRRAR